MPRPVPPPLLLSATSVTPLPLDECNQRCLAAALGLDTLPDNLPEAIGHALAGYKATITGSPDTTIGATRAALAELTPGKRGFDIAVKRFADPRYGVDYTTSNRLQPLAVEALSGGAGEREALVIAAKDRAAELENHPRIEASVEAVRFFCGLAREIFDNYAASTMERSLYNCRRFVLELLTIAGADCAHFEAHPERLDEYMLTDVSIA